MCCSNWGALLKIDGATVKRWNGYLAPGRTSNNVAEYAGLIAVLKEIAEHPGPAIIFGDSMMVIRQMQKGKLAKSDGIYVPWNHEAIRLLMPLRDRVEFEWIPREDNTVCDMLAEQALIARREYGFRAPAW
ncbi:MAG TPA: ribonuclease HI family protein [Candidatus Limnocylindrales bacterium]|nr:ribonuclease HI family protein [Candidatus Limnocylindrales bacterium]